MSNISEQTDNHKEENLIPSSRWGSDVVIDANDVEQKLLEIKNKIAPCKPRIIAVTKYYGLNAIVKAYEVGLRDFGESRALDSVSKIEALPEDIRKNSKFHFIGHLQTNKAEKVVKYFDYIHSVDSLKLARVISQVSCSLNKKERIFLQVNNAKEEQKFGYDVEQLRLEFSEIVKLPNLEVVGLMNMAPFGAGETELRELFRGLRNLRDDLEAEFEVKLPELSMGMSDDYEIAVQEGATIIRIGRKLFK